MLKVFAESAQAAEAQAPAGVVGLISSFLPFIIIIAVFYFLLIRPQKKQEKQTREMLSAIKVGDTITTIGGMVGKAAAWLLGISLTVFVAVLSFQSILSACADSVGGRMLRFSVSGFVPIVGGSLSEALYTVKGCLTMLRGSAGACGVLCAAAIVLPTLVQCVLWNVLLFPVKLTAELFGLSAVASVTEVVRSAVKTGIAVLCSSLLLMIISLTVIAVAGGGAG